MPDDWLVLEDDLHPTKAFSVELALKEEGVAHKIEEGDDGNRVLVPAIPLNIQALDLTDDLLEAYGLTREAAERKGIVIRPYKPLQRHVAFLAARSALQRAGIGGLSEHLADLLHEFVWGQPLPNANHRSALLLVAETARKQGVQIPHEHRMIEIGNAFAEGSKPLIDEKEYHPDPTPWKKRHREVAAKAVERILRG